MTGKNWRVLSYRMTTVLAVIAIAALGVGGVGAAAADEVPAAPGPEAVPAADTPCATLEGAVPDLEAVLGLSLTTGAEASSPPLIKTCRCSCGSTPCKKDSDCGPGGRCGLGITCCAG